MVKVELSRKELLVILGRIAPIDILTEKEQNKLTDKLLAAKDQTLEEGESWGNYKKT